MTSNGVLEYGRDHVVIFPYMAKGHTIPLLQFATALSVHHKNLHITLLITPANRAFARSRLPSSVELVELSFPSYPPLPAGVESTDALPCPSMYPAFLHATALLRDPFAAFLSLLPSRPLALVSDFFLGFTHRVAADAGVPRVVFHGMSCFAMAVCKALIVNPPQPAGAAFRVPGMPEGVEITVEEIPDMVARFADADDPVTRFFVDNDDGSDVRSWGVLVNSFAALDADYVAPFEAFYYEPGARGWLVGPLFLAAGDMTTELIDKELDPEGCLAWLDERAYSQPGSVIYVSFGTQAHVSDAQLDETLHGLVQSGHPFLWVVRSDTWSPPVDVGSSSRIVRGWVPQRSVLAHKAVGGFVSHCGWNSVMESLVAGKPILAWPMIAEQHLNAKHVVDIIGAGIRMVAKKDGVVERTEIEEKVKMLMDTDVEVAKKSADQGCLGATNGGGGGKRWRNLTPCIAEAY
ncbi:hypothetical protein PR202_ga15056 [Eleusine coracana subsp. coracana]|uniref:Glycosyltransferase n=1 Tax=Eleusine coracana subsp. coracana TaxID=191504 RepID=A0AAV5CI13_ELECO|nr:hypothetical protein QOZ80_6BG0497290 [Eleusine coracana subsp. coracana]GJM98081.1 hypothetical protein PR202_ga15056 [Eleusine coracana subsp. coracana]